MSEMKGGNQKLGGKEEEERRRGKKKKEVYSGKVRERRFFSGSEEQRGREIEDTGAGKLVLLVRGEGMKRMR